ncbi:MAG: DUF4105 domain-containing protein [Pirellulales bacterium]|nr:DUF4105 domain-containing protein [Pirellulales bacterium]
MNRFCWISTLLAALGCSPVAKMIAPSNVRTWEPDQAELSYAEYVNDDEILVHNVRNCRYFDEDTFVVRYENRRYKLSELKRVDFLMAPFKGMPALAHTMLSFEFHPPDGPPEHLAASVEIRKELGETYAAWKGSARQYELMYVLADERDVIELRTNHRGEDVYLYETTATPEAARRLLVDVLGRTNELAARPEFYDTVGNNCTTNIVRHINRIEPNRIKYDYRVLLPGYSDELAYKEGLIVRHGTFAETKAAAYLNARAIAAGESSDFSQAIRIKGELPSQRFAARQQRADNGPTRPR